MSKRLTFYPLKRPDLRQFSGSAPGCSEDSVSEVQKVRSLPINRVRSLSSGEPAFLLRSGLTGLPNVDAPGIWPDYLVGSTDIAGDDAGWTEVVIPGGLPVLGNLGGCNPTAILYSSRDCRSHAPKIGFDRSNLFGACHQDNRTSRSIVVSDESEFSCPTNNEVT